MDQRHLLMHQAMLGDRRRVESYDRALAAVTDENTVVADIGAGTLALTALALRHRAAHVYAVEADPQVAAVAERIIKTNGWQDRVTLIEGDARLVRLPEQVDVTVCELMGNLGPEEDMARILRVFNRRNLRPGGTVVPERVVTWLAPVQFGTEGWGIWSPDFFGMRLDVVQELVDPTAHLHFFTQEPALLGEPVALVDTGRGDTGLRNVRPLALPLHTAGTLHAVLGYFTATLAPGIELSNMPSYPGCNWAVFVWPLRHTAVAAGDTVHVRPQRPDGSAARDVTRWRLDCRLDRVSKQ
ncbi:hypothetical protein Vqi01_57250 [Micromonospora qiuiae]|uniref:PRMT5 arginine-N-methyltransferase domain-containing protein n=1 Tax=Micromonospora qiuiae TaxID=502268 RepID=A0ABQ4JIY8_9ACTN|nr:methyltransferase domain-containing protein [Micromonospora qiuiae]GIJ30563.1 hypothetical protein Vqi01_57250 [Micromonospora qiuiae]